MPRKEKKYHFIYKTTNLLSGKYYIGMHSTDNMEDGYLGSGNRIRRSIKKHGEENFSREILEFVDTRELLVEREKEVVNLDEIAKEDCINLMVGGEGGFVSTEHYIKIKKLASEHQKKKWKDPEYREKIIKVLYENNIKHHANRTDYATFTGKKHSEETKKKMSEAKEGKYDGKNNPSYGTCWITNETESKKITKGDTIPDGWRLGRKIKQL